MKKTIKTIIAGAVIVAVGLITAFIGLALNGWSFGLGAAAETFTRETYTCTGGNIFEIDGDFSAETVKTEFYGGDVVEIEYSYSPLYPVVVRERANSVEFKRQSRVFMHFKTDGEIPETVIRIPYDAAVGLDLDVSAGGAEIAEGKYSFINLDLSAGKITAKNVECTSLALDVSAGDVKMDGLNCPDMEIDVSAGEVNITVAGIKEEYGVEVDARAGACNLVNQRGTKMKNIEIDVSAGKVNIYFISP